MSTPDHVWTPGEAGVFAAIIITLQSLVHSLSDDRERESLATAHHVNVDKLSFRDDSDPVASAELRTVAHNTIARIYGGGE